MDLVLHKDLEIQGLNYEQTELIKEAQKFINPAWQQAVENGRSTKKIIKYIRLYHKRKSGLILPRGCIYKVVDLLGMPDTIQDNTSVFEKSIIPSKIDLRPLQMPWVEQALLHQQGILQAPPGAGKTVMALEIISRLGQPTLWLTHRKHLANQVIKEAHKFLDIGPIGLIGANKRTMGEHLTVGLTPTLVRNDLSEIAGKFGLVILDEAHTCPSRQCSRVLKQLYPHYMYGLTATPYREDGLTRVIFDLFGPIISSMDREKIIDQKGILPAKIKVVPTHVSLPPRCGSGLKYHEVVEFLGKHVQRNSLIISDIAYEAALGNLCVVLTTTIEHGKILCDSFKRLGIDCCHSHSKLKEVTKDEEIKRFVNGKAPILIATYSLLSEGFNYKPLNRIFFAMPMKAKGRIAQSRGRAERIYEGKEDAVVYDYVDNITMLLNQFNLRLSQYEEDGLEIIYT